MKRAVYGGILVLVVSGVLVQLTQDSGASTVQSALAPVNSERTELSLKQCLGKFKEGNTNWCEMRIAGSNPGISSVWPKTGKRIRQVMGPQIVLKGWNSAAYDPVDQILYFMGGGYSDYGGNEVYSFELQAGVWRRLTDPSPLNFYTVPKKGKPFWIPDTRAIPGSFQTYDGLLYMPETRTLLALSMGPAVGAQINSLDSLDEDALIAGGAAPGQYEFNPSATETRNGLAPLQWRLVGREKWRFPRSTALADGTLIMGSSSTLFRVKVDGGKLRKLAKFATQADYGNGTLAYDKKRDWLWSMHKNVLLAFDNNGRKVRKYSRPPNPSKSIAFDTRGRIVCWDGGNRIAVLDPDQEKASWVVGAWPGQGPGHGEIGRVYQKWRHLGNDVFAGVSSHKNGVSLFQVPTSGAGSIVISTVNIQALLDKAKPGAEVTIPPGAYSVGLRINKPVVLNLAGVELMGVVGGKGIVVVENVKGAVIINDFVADGRVANATSGNLAAVRISGKNFDVTINRAKISHTVMGILSDNRGGHLRIYDSVLGDTGDAGKRTNLSHVIYAGSIDELEIRKTSVIGSNAFGHLVKSRATETLIEDSRLLGMATRHSRVIDLSCGGELIVRGSILQSSSQTDNADMISVGVERASHCGGALRAGDVSITDSTIVFDRDGSKDEPARMAGRNILFNWRTPVANIELRGNTIVNPMGKMRWQSPAQKVALPDLSPGNQIFSSRLKAGLNPVENSVP